MTDKKNIVIKVKYPASGRAADYVPAPQMITEWNVKRILLAVGVIVLILVSLVYFIGKDTQDTDLGNSPVPPEAIVNTPEKQEAPQELTIKKSAVDEVPGNPVKPKTEVNPKKIQPASTKPKEVVKKQPNHKLIKESRNPKVNNVRRALLTYEINNKEPVGEIAQTINISQTKPVLVYYYNELNKMNGRKVYHEWWKNGMIVTRQELNISADTWRTSSRKLLTDNAKGNWAVRLVDENGQILNEKTFKVDLIK